jgi:hypothetical protein
MLNNEMLKFFYDKENIMLSWLNNSDMQKALILKA